MTAAVVFVDGQNLAHSLRRAFGVKLTNFDLVGLAHYVCSQNGWDLAEVRFYTGLPSKEHEPGPHSQTARRLSQLGRLPNVYTWSRRLSYAPKTTECKCGHKTTRIVGREKGVDLRIALDAVRLAVQGQMDVAVFFTQDQDFFEAVKEVRALASHGGRKIVVASVFPLGEGGQRSGIRGTLQIPFTVAEFAPFRRG